MACIYGVCVCANNAGLVMGFDIYNEIFIEIVKKKHFEIQKKNS